jgi:hypothetical protein
MILAQKGRTTERKGNKFLLIIHNFPQETKPQMYRDDKTREKFCHVFKLSFLFQFTSLFHSKKNWKSSLFL